MKYMPGGTLKGHMGQPMPYNQAARILTPIARALAYAHGEGVLHRDVKPANILITQSGEPVLTDFGIAKLIENEKGQTLTSTGMGIGTPEYMAPEQGLAQKVDGRADVYALGIVFYELITGRKPFAADTPMAVLLKQVNDPLPRPKDFIALLPDEVEQVILKALAKDPEDRYENMEAFSQALEKLSAGSVPATMPTQQPRADMESQGEEAETIDELDTFSAHTAPAIDPAPHKKKSKWLYIGIGIAAVALIGVGIIFGMQRNKLTPPVADAPAAVAQATTEPEKAKHPASPTSNPTKKPTSAAPTPAAPQFSIEDIPLYDDFENGPTDKWYVADWSDLENYQIEGEDGKLHIQVEGEQWSTYKAMFYYLNDPEPAKAFFAKIRVKAIAPDAVVSLTFKDYKNWYNFAIDEYQVSLQGEDLSWRRLFDDVTGKDIWIGVYVEDETAYYYINERLLATSEINGRIRRNEIGFEIGSATSGGLTNLEIDEVRILFDE
jgi:serine/threonine protein kinase